MPCNGPSNIRKTPSSLIHQYVSIPLRIIAPREAHPSTVCPGHTHTHSRTQGVHAYVYLLAGQMVHPHTHTVTRTDTATLCVCVCVCVRTDYANVCDIVDNRSQSVPKVTFTLAVRRRRRSGKVFRILCWKPKRVTRNVCRSI